jgi:phosphomannomutase
MTADTEIAERARAWLAQDPDPDTRAELDDLLRKGDTDELRARFDGRLEFGTAGLRGPLGAGSRRMNQVTVMRAAAGLCHWLGPATSIVIGYDARHKSRAFAYDTARVAAGAGLRAALLPGPLPTPLLAYAVRHLGADAGVVVTASHNPPQDNGYKVYVGDGSQIIPPVDAEISAAIDAVGPVDELPLGDDWTVLGRDVIDAYLAALTRLPLGDARDVAMAYTPMHGVGRDTALAAFARTGFAAPAVVAEQAEPDPDFPTVAFPNPEEPGAMDLAMALGSRTSAGIVLANDPDADRCAVAVMDGSSGRRLTGDETGGLLAEHVLGLTSGADRLVATTIVSSSLLAKIAEAHGVRYTETLTGFKWLARAGGPGDRLVYAYEEALGYCVGGDDGPPVRDKDGIGAALAIAGMAAAAKRAGRTLFDLLDDQARRYGVHATRQVSIRVEELALIADAMRRLRAGPPTAFGAARVERTDDLLAGGGGLPPSDVLRYRLAAGARVIIRPSGTEPKIKAYLEVVEPVSDDLRDARSAATTRLDALESAVTETIGL